MATHSRRTHSTPTRIPSSQSLQFLREQPVSIERNYEHCEYGTLPPATHKSVLDSIGVHAQGGQETLEGVHGYGRETGRKGEKSMRK